MSEDRSEHESKSWLDKLAHAFSDEPRSREDVLQILYAAGDSGILDQDELGIVEGAMNMSQMQVRDVMIPRSQMSVVNLEQSPREILSLIITSAHSRFPVCGENPDEIVGLLLAKDLLPYLLDGTFDNCDLLPLLRKPTFIPESKRLNVLLNEFRATHNHMAIVVDEYGGIAGLVTIEDVIEQIVGEIEDEHDADDDEGNIKPFDDNGFIVKALTPIEDFNEYFHSQFSDDDFDTIGGIVTQRFGYLPQKDENVDLSGFNFKVLSSDSRRIRLLQVTRL